MKDEKEFYPNKQKDPVYFCSDCQQEIQFGGNCELNRIGVLTPCNIDESKPVLNDFKEINREDNSSKKQKEPVYFCSDCEQEIKYGGNCGLKRKGALTPCNIDDSKSIQEYGDLN